MNDDLLRELEESAEPTTAELLTMSELVSLQIVREGEVDRLEAELKVAKENLNDVRDKKLPDAMKAARTKLYVNDDGRKVELKDEMTLSIPKKRLDEIIKKLRDWDLGDMIANTLTCEIDKGKDNLAGEIMEKANELGLEMTRAESVNSGTLKSTLKAKRKAGEDVDLGFFGAFEVTRAKIT